MTGLAAADVARLRPRRERQPRQWVTAAAVLVVVGLVVRAFVTNGDMRWDVVGRFLFSPQILAGVVGTIELTALSQALATGLGVIIALLQQSRNPVSSSLAAFYVWFFRAVPLLVQLLFWFNVGLLVPTVGVSIPGTDAGFQVSTNVIISGFTAAILGLGLHEAAYMAEIIRAGVLSVPQGQIDAALSIGLERGQAMRRIVLPQAIRVIIPPTGNQFIGLLKASALVSAIGGGDLLTQAQFLYGENFLVIPILTVATIWYLVLVTIASAIQHLVETSRVETSAAAPSFAARLLQNLPPIGRRRI